MQGTDIVEAIVSQAYNARTPAGFTYVHIRASWDAEVCQLPKLLSCREK